MKNSYSFLRGFISAIIVTATVTAFAESELIANISSQIFYWNNEKIELPAYNINGYNYVKLRDISSVFGVEVDYDCAENSVYLGQQPQAEIQAVTGEKTHIADGNDYAREDYSLMANQDIFDDIYTRSAYNTIRQSITDQSEIISGNDENGYNPNYSYAHYIDHTQTLQETGQSALAMNKVLGSINGYYVYLMGREPDLKDYWKYPGYYICKPTIHKHFEPANTATDEFIKSLSELQVYEKAERIASYICDKIYYNSSVGSAGINEIFTSDKEVGGICGDYSSAFVYLCQRAGIPCISVVDEEHAWNEVYVDGKWQITDIGYYDAANKKTELFPKNYARNDKNPKVSQFAKELLVPNSTT